MTNATASDTSRLSASGWNVVRVISSAVWQLAL